MGSTPYLINESVIYLSNQSSKICTGHLIIPINQFPSQINININDTPNTSPSNQLDQNISDKLQTNLSLSLSQKVQQGPTFILRF